MWLKLNFMVRTTNSVWRGVNEASMKVHHPSCEAWRWISDVLSVCELQRHRTFRWHWWKDECMLSENTGVKFEFNSNNRKHKAKSTLQQKKEKVLWPSQSPDLDIIEPLWGDLRRAVWQPKHLQSWKLFAKKNGRLCYLRKIMASSRTIRKHCKLSLMLKDPERLSIFHFKIIHIQTN